MLLYYNIDSIEITLNGEVVDCEEEAICFRS